ncbi:MAG: SDR family oxidoreductase [Planctomycetes bacterium]|nr:SDR family oxidoreductase [Planctomycetota bacterium]
MTVDLSGKIALVTGAGRNIGRAIAETLAANGATVVFTDLKLADVEAAAQGVPRAAAMALDVSDEAAAARVVADTIARFGRIDIVVNNAGINTATRVPVDQFPRSEWDRILAIDLSGLFFVSRAAAGAMRRQKSGRIINITSVAGLVPLRLQCAFTAAKAGVVQLTKAMAIELGGDGILVNAIAPGSILTDGTKQLFYGDPAAAEKASRMLSHVPLGRPGACADIANAALFLAAPESGYVTGHVLTVDGGWTAGYTRDF